MFAEWLKIFQQIATDLNAAKENQCPECGHQGVDFQFVGDQTKKLGYLAIWCDTCKKGVNLSRVNIPNGTPIISFADSPENVSKRIPNFQVIGPDTD
jgi:hypothetical protein